MKKIILTLVLFLAVTSTAFAQCWVQVSENEYIDKDSIKYYVDDNSHTDYSKKIFWVKSTSESNNDENVIQKESAFDLAQLIIDNAKQAYTIKSIIKYGNNNLPIFEGTLKDFELKWNLIVPGTKGNLWANLVNNPRHLKKMYKEQLKYNK